MAFVNPLTSASQAFTRLKGITTDGPLQGGEDAGKAAWKGATWRLEIQDPTHHEKLTQWMFRWPPSTFTLEQSIRSDVNLDLLGKVAKTFLGPGLGRLSIQGSHGVRKVDTGTLTWAGIERREDLDAFFATWEELAKEANAQKKAYPLLVLIIQNGSISEWSYAAWELWPLARPTTERDASKPLEWRYSMQFWVLGELGDRATPDPISFEGEAAKIAASAATTFTSIASTVKTTLATAKTAKAAVTSFATALQNLRSGVLGAIRSVRSSLQEINAAAADIETALGTQSFNRQATGEMRRMGRELRMIAGIGKRLVCIHDRTTTASAAAPIIAAPLPTLASRALGEASRWKDIATVNGIAYPYQPQGPVRLPER